MTKPLMTMMMMNELKMNTVPGWAVTGSVLFCFFINMDFLQHTVAIQTHSYQWLMFLLPSLEGRKIEVSLAAAVGSTQSAAVTCDHRRSSGPWSHDPHGAALGERGAAAVLSGGGRLETHWLSHEEEEEVFLLPTICFAKAALLPLETTVSALTNASFTARLHILFCSSTFPTCLHMEGFISLENLYFCFPFSLFSLHFMAMKFEQVICMESVSVCAAWYANTREVRERSQQTKCNRIKWCFSLCYCSSWKSIGWILSWTEIIPCWTDVCGGGGSEMLMTELWPHWNTSCDFHVFDVSRPPLDSLVISQQLRCFP